MLYIPKLHQISTDILLLQMLFLLWCGKSSLSSHSPSSIHVQQLIKKDMFPLLMQNLYER